MRVLALAVAAFALSTALVALAPASGAEPHKLPPEYVGGYCGWHWHEGDVENGELPGYHYHHCI